ncbi:MAG: hypothetical protein O6705_08270, partial [Actinobacteria bacterium]|nr:hypothetical protein [Actinomycetota bacterium]
MTEQPWHGTKKCAVNGAKIPRDLQVAGHRCPLCGNTLGANFDGTVKPGFDSPSAPTAMVAEYVQRRRAARERKRIRREVEFARYEYRNFNDLRIKGLVLEGSGLMAEQDFARAESFQDVAKTTPRWSAMEEEQFSLSSVTQWRRVWSHLADTAMLRVAVTEYGHRKDLAETD